MQRELGNPGRSLGYRYRIYVEGFIPLQYERKRPFHLLVRNFIAVHFEYSGASLADAAHVVECQCPGTEPLIFKVKLDGVFPGARSPGFPSEGVSSLRDSKGTRACLLEDKNHSLQNVLLR